MFNSCFFTNFAKVNYINMKLVTHCILRLLVVASLLIIYSSAQAITKRALLVGISNYSTNSATQWTDIHGTNDVELLATTLKSQKYIISKVTNQQATAKRIRKELKSLVNSCKPGDMVYIHFSGHGQPFEDKSGDEEDGWDEAIVPYDAQKVYIKGKYEGANHIIDDELSKYFDQIRTKIGTKGFLCVVIDACHSGGSSRGDELEEDEELFIRGTRDGFSPNGKDYRPRVNTNGHFVINSNRSQGEILILEACRSYQSNCEIKQDGQYYGPLSYYVNTVLRSNQLSRSLNWVQEVKRMMDCDRRLTRQNMVIETSLK